MYQHNRPDGSICPVAGRAGKKCLRCGTMVRSFEHRESAVVDVPNSDDGSKSEFDGITTAQIVDELRSRGAEIGSIELGPVKGQIIVLRAKS